MMHWSDQYIGKPWQSYATGPDSFDCWGLVVDALHRVFKQGTARHLDALSGDFHAFHRTAMDEIATGRWVKTDQPRDGDIVLMARHKVYMHVGIVAGSAILHVREGTGACRESVEGLGLLFKRIEYWTYER